MRAPYMKRWLCPCPARPVLRLQFLLKVGQCFRLVSPLRVHTDAAAASTEPSTAPFIPTPPTPTKPSFIRYSQAPAPRPSPPLPPSHQNRFITYPNIPRASFFTLLWRHLWSRPLSPDWLVLALDRWPLVSHGTLRVRLRKHWNLPWI